MSMNSKSFESSVERKTGLSAEVVLSIEPFLYKMAHGLIGGRSWRDYEAKCEVVNELVQAGMVGALEAARTFEPSRGFRFITFAAWHARGRMLDLLNRESSAEQNLVLATGGPGEEDVNYEESLDNMAFQNGGMESEEDSTERSLQLEYLHKRLDAILTAMPRKEREVFKHIHGLESDAVCITELAKRWGNGVDSLRACLKRAEERVRQGLAKNGIRSSRDVMGFA